MNNKNMLKGHLWQKDTGFLTGWTGWDGTFTCQRCLSVKKGSRLNNSSPYTFEWQKDCDGKDVPKNKQSICSADK